MFLPGYSVGPVTSGCSVVAEFPGLSGLLVFFKHPSAVDINNDSSTHAHTTRKFIFTFKGEGKNNGHCYYMIIKEN